MSSAPPPAWRPDADPRQHQRETVFAQWSRRAVVLVGVLALAGALVPGGAGRTLAGLAIAVVVALPLLRVLWLVALWRHQRDRRFVAAGLALLGLVALGVVAAALRGS
jgi:Na+/proline symporter